MSQFKNSVSGLLQQHVQLTLYHEFILLPIYLHFRPDFLKYKFSLVVFYLQEILRAHGKHSMSNLLVTLFWVSQKSDFGHWFILLFILPILSFWYTLSPHKFPHSFSFYPHYVTLLSCHYSCHFLAMFFLFNPKCICFQITSLIKANPSLPQWKLSFTAWILSHIWIFTAVITCLTWHLNTFLCILHYHFMSVSFSPLKYIYVLYLIIGIKTLCIILNNIHKSLD